MCGIAGFYPSVQRDASADILKRMLTRIKHRGPDQSGIYIDKGVAMGSVRLSIIDIPTGGMPLSNGDKSLWITFNGEIFNYIELKEELKKKGHIFRTNSDTEVILHLYEQYGTSFLNRLNGQFAIAIWDRKKDQLFLARDRVGIRPLFYTNIKNQFVFASEIKALLEYPGIEPRISPIALSQVFTFWTTISPKTIFQDIFEVPPGHYMTVTSSGIEHKCYWELPLYKPEIAGKPNFDNAVDEFAELFSDAVRLRLRADVPVGAYLSGGIDSCVTTSFIKSLGHENLRTFSIGFYDTEFDETVYQNEAVKYLKTNHSYLKCSYADIADSFSAVVCHSETPLLRTAPGPMYLLSKKVRDNQFKVVITGEGADELLGGYDIFKEALIRQFWAKDPGSNIRPALLKKLYPYLPQMSDPNLSALKFFYGYRLNETQSPIYSHLLRWNNTSRIKNYLSQDYKTAVADYDPVDEVLQKVESKLSGHDLLSRAQWLEMHLFMSGYLLSSQGDRMAMANSVEGRYPFLDYRIIDFCMKLPPKFKLCGLNEKVLLKRMMAGKLPDQILKRSKQPYRAPITESFFGHNAPAYVLDTLSGKQLHSTGIFDPEKVSQLLTRMQSKGRMSEIDNMAITGILSTQILNSLFFKKTTLHLSKKQLPDCDITIISD